MLITKIVSVLAASLLTFSYPVAAFAHVNEGISQIDRKQHFRPTVALALGGGGVRGAAHIGVLKVLERERIPIDYIVGSSMGAIVGGMYAAGVPLDNLEKMFRDRSLLKAFVPIPIALKVTTVPVSFLFRSLKRAVGIDSDFAGLYSENNVAAFVKSHLPLDMQRVEETKIPFAAVVTNLIDGTTLSLDTGDLGRAVQASSAVPLYVRPLRYDDKLLVDGGLRANVPVEQAKQSGADIVISVNVDETLVPANRRTLKTLGGMSNRVMSIMLTEIDKHHAANSDLEIKPDLVGVPLYSRRSADVNSAMLAGEEAAMQAIPRIRALINSGVAASANAVDQKS